MSMMEKDSYVAIFINVMNINRLRHTHFFTVIFPASVFKVPLNFSPRIQICFLANITIERKVTDRREQNRGQ